MRIGIDIEKALPPRDGIGHYTADLIRALIDVTEETGGEDELFLYSLGCPLDPDVLHRELPGFPDHANPREGRPQTDELDLFHSTAWRLPGSVRCPLVFTCYDLTFLSHPELHTPDNKISCLTATLEAILEEAVFLTISQTAARELEAWLGLDPSSVRVVYPAAGAIFCRGSEEESRRRLRGRFGLEGDFLLAVGTLEPRKNLPRLLKAYAGLPRQLRERHPFVVAGGEGWKLDVEDLPWDETTRRLGFVERGDLVDLYRAAALFAYPSLAEGFGLPVLEAMACGAPVLTSNLSSLPEVAGDAACLVDPTDVEAIRAALLNLIEKPADRLRLRELGLARAASFSWRKAARETLEIYRETARTAGRPDKLSRLSRHSHRTMPRI